MHGSFAVVQLEKCKRAAHLAAGLLAKGYSECPRYFVRGRLDNRAQIGVCQGASDVTGRLA
jgi:hypothetical protein